MHRSLQDPSQPPPASVSAVPENSLAQKPGAAATFSNVPAPPHDFTSIASNTTLDVPLTQRHPSTLWLILRLRASPIHSLAEQVPMLRLTNKFHEFLQASNRGAIRASRQCLCLSFGPCEIGLKHAKWSED
jgi:hypothetical protein